MNTMKNVLELIPLIFTNYLLGILFLCGAILFFFISGSLSEFPIEERIAKWGGLLYMILGAVLFILTLAIG